MRRLRGVRLVRWCGGALALVAALVACGDSETEVASGSSTTTTSSTTPAPTTTTSLVTKADGSTYVRHVGAWKLAGTDESGRVLTLDVPISGCTKFQTVEVDEQADSVRITVVMETFLEGPPDAEFETACGDELGRHRETVELTAPLGERELLGECAPRGPGDVDCSGLAR